MEEVMDSVTKKRSVRVSRDPDANFKASSIENFIVAKIREGKTGRALEKKLTHTEEDQITAIRLFKKEKIWKEFTRYVKMMVRSNQYTGSTGTLKI
jgi:hypothetical protein